MRVPVDLAKSYRLLNHGPVCLVSAAADGRQNVMAAAWVMPLDFDPPKFGVVVACEAFTRELVEASGALTLSIPCRAQLDLVQALGTTSGRDLDKAARYGLTLTQGTRVSAPLVEGCVGWLECRVLPEPHLQAAYDLFIVEAVAAFAEDTAFQNGRWAFSRDDQRTLHHVAGGSYFVTGEAVTAAPERL